jgi:hypothetical protein
MLLLTTKLKTVTIAALLLTVFGSLFTPLEQVHGQASMVPDVTDETAKNELCDDWIPSVECVAAWVAWLMLSATSALLSMAAWLLNWVVLTFVIQMGATVNAIDAIPRTWIVLRDIGNLVFVFAMLVIGIATILRIQGYGYKRLLFQLIVAALLINFSLFFAKLVIDTANVFSQAAYRQIEQSAAIDGTCMQANPQNPEDPNTQNCINKGLSSAFMEPFELETLFARPDPDDGSLTDLDPSNIFLIGLFGSFMLLVTSFVFVAAAILLAIRFIVLTFLMILSPIAFAGAVLPQTRGLAARWWRTLFSQAFFAPVLLLFFWVSLQVLNSVDGLYGEGATISDALGGDGNRASIFVVFILAIGFMFGSLMAAQSLGAYGASRAVATGRSWGRKAAYGTAGFASAYTAGAVGKKMRELQDRGVAQYDQNTLRGRMYRRLSDISARPLTNLEQKKFFGTQSYKERAAADRARGKQVAVVQREMDFESAANRIQTAEDDMQKVRAEINAAQDAGNTPDPALVSRLSTLQNNARYREDLRTIRGASVKLLEQLPSKTLADSRIAQHLRSSQVDDLRKSDEFTDQQKTAIRQAKWKELRTAVTRTPRPDTDYLRSTVPRLGANELKNIDAELLVNPAFINHLSAKDLAAIDRADTLTEPQMKAIRNHVEFEAAHGENARRGGQQLTASQQNALEAEKFFNTNAGRLWPR